jgi:hypothetical protein
MGAIVIMAANEGINHETGYRHEHEKKKAWEGHYIPLAPAYAIRQGQLEQPRRTRYEDGHLRRT